MVKLRLVLWLFVTISFSSTSQAALIDRGGGLIYDSVLNVTWLADANYAKTSGFASVSSGCGSMCGAMDWQTARNWVDNLTYYDSVRNVTYDDWRLPTVRDTGMIGCNDAFSGTDCGYNVQTASGGSVFSELAAMYYDNLGFKGRYAPTEAFQADFGLFGNGSNSSAGIYQLSGVGPNGAIRNVQPYYYWLQVVSASGSTGATWYFNMDNGNQRPTDDPSFLKYVWAVRDGDVAASPVSTVPLPNSLLLMTFGVAGLAGIGSRPSRTVALRRLAS